MYKPGYYLPPDLKPPAKGKFPVISSLTTIPSDQDDVDNHLGPAIYHACVSDEPFSLRSEIIR